MELSERKKKILKSIVDAYIESGEPIGSKFLSTSYDFSVSPATIRNEMSELEELGFLEQPHTSAGRVPTALGFKTYVNSLMEKYFLTMEELNLLNELTSFKLNELSRTLEQASRVISRLTNYTSFSVLRSPEHTAIRYETLLIDPESFLIVMICDNDIVKSTRLKSAIPVDEIAVKSIQDSLNSALTGIRADEITMPVFISFEKSLGRFGMYASDCVKAVYEMLSADCKEHVHVDGVTKLLSYPEYSSVSNAKSVLSIIEEQNKLIELLYMMNENKLNLYITDDDNILPAKDTSFVFHPITYNGKQVGAIGVIGPKRMDYKKVIASLKYLASGISVELTEKKRKGEAETIPKSTAETDFKTNDT